MQTFKGDGVELNFYEVGRELFDELSFQRDIFFNEAYECYELGQMIWENQFSPLANAIRDEVFRASFSSIFESFTFAGSLESYLTVFRNVFGDDVDVTFTVPDPGKLQIDIVASSVQLDVFISRYIENNEYFFDEMIDDENDTIVFQSFKGLESEYELNQILFEMVPAGIYTEITLTIDV